jgi:hypothetical protein
VHDRAIDYDPAPQYGVVNGDGKYVMKWLLGLFSGLILIVVTADITWQISQSGRMSAVELQQATMGAKIDWLVDYAKRTRGM